MNRIQLRYVANEITRERGLIQQSLSFLILVDNPTFSKQVDVIWADDDEVWHTLPASFHSTSETGQEYWVANANFLLSAASGLPGNIQVLGKEYWDNNHEQNYHCQSQSCIQKGDQATLLNLGFNHRLMAEQTRVPISVAVNLPLQAKTVSVHWTIDDWKHAEISYCYQKSKLTLERGGQSLVEGVQIWKTQLNIADAFRLQYCICCETEDQVCWDNNHGQNFTSSRKPLNVLILNLHCYQEEDQDYKFSVIAKAIDELCVDVVCLQEVAENWNDGQGDWQSNSARIINERLAVPYHLYTSWSHLGFDRYREGVAILSRLPIDKKEARYVSNSVDPYDIHARKVVMAQITVPNIGLINCFSSHVSWWADGFAEHFENLHTWADSQHRDSVKATLLCGDFNIKAGSRGYELVVNSNDYEDQYLAIQSPTVFERVFHDRRSNWQRYLADDHRIDYIFKKRSSELQVIAARVIFNELEYARVSDHEGYLMTFEPK
jgi:maltose 6'-phosphate phosphatase